MTATVTLLMVSPDPGPEMANPYSSRDGEVSGAGKDMVPPLHSRNDAQLVVLASVVPS